MDKYDELDELFFYLNDHDKLRIIYRYVLRLPVSKIAIIETRSTTAVYNSLQKANSKLKDLRTHTDLIASLQVLFTLK